MIRQARQSFPAFVAYVFGVEPAPFHIRWTDAIERHDRVVILAPLEHGKTTLMLAYVLWRLGLDPNVRIALVHATHGQALRPMAAIKEHIQENPRLREIFPRPGTGDRRASPVGG